MRGAPLRISRHPGSIDLSEGDEASAGKYAGAITKLIPGEIVAAYMTGKSLIVANATVGPDGSSQSSVGWWVGWTIFCFGMVIVTRAWTTSDLKSGVPPEWPAVGISALSFVVWVYSFGDVFQALGLWSEVGSGLVLIGWTLVAPAILMGWNYLRS